MMGIDAARVSDPVIGNEKKKEKDSQPDPVMSGNNPIFSSEEKKLNIEVPEGWKTVGE
jgi:hypothetical protein